MPDKNTNSASEEYQDNEPCAVLHINNEHDTGRIACIVSKHLKAGDIILLDGPLASGKTFFVRCLVQQLGYTKAVTSPTYTIAHVYATPSVTVLHIDAYRLKNCREFRHLGLDEYIEDSVTVVEWGMQVHDMFSDFLRAEFATVPAHNNSRIMKLFFHGDRWLPVISVLNKEYSDI